MRKSRKEALFPSFPLKQKAVTKSAKLLLKILLALVVFATMVPASALAKALPDKDSATAPAHASEDSATSSEQLFQVAESTSSLDSFLTPETLFASEDTEITDEQDALEEGDIQEEGKRVATGEQSTETSENTEDTRIVITDLSTRGDTVKQLERQEGSKAQSTRSGAMLPLGNYENEVPAKTIA